MNAIDESKTLRRNGYSTGTDDDGTVTVRHEHIAVLRLESYDAIPGAGRRVIDELLRVVRAYGEPLIRRDDRSLAVVFQTEHGQGARLRDSLGRDFEVGFRCKGADNIVTLRLEDGGGRFGVRTDGKFEGGKSPLNTPRRALAMWPHEAEADLREELQAVLDAAAERGDIHRPDVAVSAPRSRRGELIYADDGPDMSDPKTWDTTDPRWRIEGHADAVRARRLAAGLDRKFERYVPGS